MSKEDEERTLVPKLRFPEFRKDGEWETEKLENLIKTITPPKRINTSNYLKQGTFPIIDQSQSFFCGWTNDEDAIISENSPLIIFGDHTCILKFVDISFAQGADGVKIIKPQGSIKANFLYQYLLFNPVRQEEYKRHFSILKDKLIFFPKIEAGEQQKIANCLSSLDDLITAESQKLETIREHKKGLMQRLFPADGEQVPKLRFKEFKNKEEWKECFLEKLIDLQSGFAFQSAYFTEGVGEKLLTPKNFTKDGYANFDKNNTKYTTENHDQKYICKEGDLVILITDLTPSCELLGKPLLLTQKDGEVLLNQRIVKVILKEMENSYMKFLFFFFSSEKFHKRIKDTATGSTVRHSSNTIIFETEVSLPSLEEQQKIADCLFSLDDLITAQNQKLEALKVHKKGLMQQLFPNIHETENP